MRYRAEGVEGVEGPGLMDICSSSYLIRRIGLRDVVPWEARHDLASVSRRTALSIVGAQKCVHLPMPLGQDDAILPGHLIGRFSF